MLNLSYKLPSHARTSQYLIAVIFFSFLEHCALAMAVSGSVTQIYLPIFGFSDGRTKLLHAAKSRVVIHTSKTRTPSSRSGPKRAKKAWEPQWATRP